MKEEAKVAEPAKQWQVNSGRYGWGWDVIPPNGEPNIEPLSSSLAAQAFCDAMNAGKSRSEAWEEARKLGYTRQ